jgi:glycosyltransferase involved in cell wall biosynthesis
VHFGDGPERTRVESEAASLPPDVIWELRGQVDNATVRAYYQTHAVSVFLSLSASEGVPVSMMEAQSFGIPIVALAVGGVPEIVTTEVGILLEDNAGISDIGAALEAAIAPAGFDREEIRRIFATRYDATRNFGFFADAALSILTSARPATK